VLDEEAPVGLRGGDSPLELLNHVPLMEPGEDQRVRALLPAGLVAGPRLGDPDEPRKDRQPRITLEYLLPEVRGLLPVRIQRVTRTAVLGATVERQEPCLHAVELRGHPDLVLGHGEVHQRPGTVAEQREGLLALGLENALAVLLLGVLDRLCVLGLDLSCRDGDSVEEEHEVDGLVAVPVVDLPHHP
jgi:hypothetical protein